MGGGGAERVTSRLLANLDRSRFRLSLCLLRNSISYPIPDDVDVVALNRRTCTKSGIDIPLSRAIIRRPWISTGTLWRLRQMIKDTNPDVVVSNIELVNCLTGTVLRSIYRAPKWIARVGSDPTRGSFLFKPLRSWSYSRANTVVVNSERLGRSIRDRHLKKGIRVDTIANVIDFDDIDRLSLESPVRLARTNRPLIMSMGRFIQEKRYDILIDAFARVRASHDAELWICGDGLLRTQIERDIQSRGLRDHVRLLGNIQNPFPLLKQANIFVMTSDTEGLPNALIEAQGLGIPAVATNCNYGPDEIIEADKTGYLVPTGSGEAVTAAINRLLTDPQQRQVIGRQASERVRRLFDVKLLTRKWEDEFEELCR